MAKLSEIDWNLLKFEYEVLGKSLEEIQAENEINPSIMAYQAKDWVQAPLSQREKLHFTNLSSVHELTEEITAQIKEQTNQQLLLKQNHLLPRYIKLENILLEKSINIASSLESSTPGAASTLRALAKILLDLLQYNPLLSPKVDSNETSDDGSREWTVTFVDAPAKSSREAQPVPDEKEAI
jgi:hypothetical protein